MDHNSHASHPLSIKSLGIIVWCHQLSYFLLHLAANHQLLHTQGPCRGGALRGPAIRLADAVVQRNDNKPVETPCEIDERSQDVGKNNLCISYGDCLYML